jgi:hypothetical protein
MFQVIDNKLVYRRYDRVITLDSLDYASQFERLIRYGFRVSFAAVLASGGIVDTGELLEFGVEFGLIERM